jgi:hypothetical protein
MLWSFSQLLFFFIFETTTGNSFGCFLLVHFFHLCRKLFKCKKLKYSFFQFTSYHGSILFTQPVRLRTATVAQSSHPLLINHK